MKSIPKMMIRKKPAAALGLAAEEGKDCGDNPQKKPAAPKEGEEHSDDPLKKPAAPEEGEEHGDNPLKKPAAALEEGKECDDDSNKRSKICKDAEGQWNTSDGSPPYFKVVYWSKNYCAVRQHKDLGYRQIIPVNVKHATMEENTEICDTLIEELLKGKSEDDVKLLCSHMRAALEKKIFPRIDAKSPMS